MNSKKGKEGTWLSFRDAMSNLGPLRALFLFPLFLYTFSAWSLVMRPSMSAPDEDCGLRNSSVEHYTDLVEKVSIRGEDTREVNDKYSGTMPLVCNKQGSTKTSGSINLISGSKAITILHNLIDLETCTAEVKLDECYIYDGELLYPINWEKDPVAQCKDRAGKDGVVVAELKGPKPKRPEYKFLCGRDIEQNDLDTVKVVASESDNFMGLSKSKLGRSVIVGDGKLYEILKNSGTIKYENDTGPGASGGAVIGRINGKEYLIGIHVGDNYGQEEESILNSTGSLDGLPANEDTFYGQGLILGKEIAECR